MANLKEVRNRIKSVISTQQITKAMKMVSAAKLRRAQQAILQMRPYANKLNQMMSNIMSFSDGQGAEIFGRSTEKENRYSLLLVQTVAFVVPSMQIFSNLPKRKFKKNIMNRPEKETLPFCLLEKKVLNSSEGVTPSVSSSTTMLMHTMVLVLKKLQVVQLS